ncbi:hypothetical protein [Mucilaginibacter sp.]|uniref:hypothetical protein n=1 Tax=Mucilaginibacter sp. TaxID=1882438 RepID=UPI00374CFB7C
MLSTFMEMSGAHRFAHVCFVTNGTRTDRHRVSCKPQHHRLLAPAQITAKYESIDNQHVS